MCRWIFYYGEEVCLGKLLYGATHGLANMSEGAGYTPGCERNHRRNHPVNVHGGGVGWYACDRCGRKCDATRGVKLRSLPPVLLLIFLFL